MTVVRPPHFDNFDCGLGQKIFGGRAKKKAPLQGEPGPNIFQGAGEKKKHGLSNEDIFRNIHNVKVVMLVFAGQHICWSVYIPSFFVAKCTKFHRRIPNPSYQNKTA